MSMVNACNVCFNPKCYCRKCRGKKNLCNYKNPHKSCCFNEDGDDVCFKGLMKQDTEFFFDCVTTA